MEKVYTLFPGGRGWQRAGSFQEATELVGTCSRPKVLMLDEPSLGHGLVIKDILI